MRRLTLLVALALNACSRSCGPAPSGITAEAASSASAPLPAGALPPSGEAMCSALAEQAVTQAQALLDAAFARAKAEGGTNLDDVTDTLPEFVGECFPAPGGAWLVNVREAKTTLGFSYSRLELRWSLDYVDPAGTRRASVMPSEHGDDPKPGSFNYTSGPDTYEIALTPHDYDGDGAPEIIVQLKGKYHEGEVFEDGRIYTLKQGAITRYAPAKGLPFATARDVDGDGRPDLVSYEPFTAVAEGCGSGFGYRVSGPALLAHALPDGSFSLKDEVAAQAARKECPSKPTTIVEEGRDADTEASARNVACARLWGVSTAELNKRIAAECTRSDSKDACPPDDCRDANLLYRWAATDPPLVLK